MPLCCIYAEYSLVITVNGVEIQFRRYAAESSCIKGQLTCPVMKLIEFMHMNEPRLGHVYIHI